MRRIAVSVALVGTLTLAGAAQAPPAQDAVEQARALWDNDDVKRLERYVAEMKFAMPVAHGDRVEAEKLFKVTDVPATFYVDPTGTIRYEARGLEPHGDATARIAWFIEELKR